jgi:hypothetical protein
LQKAGASSEVNTLPPRDVTAEVIVVRKALAELLLGRADGAGSPGSHSAQDPYLAVVLDFTASLVTDLTYAKRFVDKNVWHRCVGVYMASWLPDHTDDGAEFAELVCKHFYAIEKVSFLTSLCPTTHNDSYRPSTHLLMMGLRKRASSSVTLSSHSPMVPFSFYRTQPSSSTAGAVTVYWVRMGLGSPPLCANYGMEK